MTEERLKELIEQGATIYSKYRSYLLKNEKEHKLDFWYRRIVEIKDNKLHYVYEDSDYYEDFDHLIKLEDLFETKEDVEFALRYKRIPRTEYLDLPTWDEFNKDNFGVRFYNKSREFCLHRVRYSANDKNPLWKIDLYESYGDDEDTVAWEKSWDLTKENYLETCEVARKLWLGEEV